MENVCENLKSNFINTSYFFKCKNICSHMFLFVQFEKKLRPAFWHEYNAV